MGGTINAMQIAKDSKGLGIHPKCTFKIYLVMKEFVKVFLRGVALVLVPAMFIIALFFALNQSFGISLTIIISLFIVQLLLSKKYKESFQWIRYKNFNFQELTEEGKFYKSLNILFNATKILSVLGVLELVYINYSEILNPFGGLGVAILVCLAIIGILIISLSGRNKHGVCLQNYQIVRGCFAVVTMMLIVSFVYLTFGTQLIWVIFLAMLSFAFFSGNREIEEGFNIEEDKLSFCSFAATLIVAIVSTIIQFWSYISNFFSIIGNFIVKVGTYEFLPGGQVWVAILVISVLAAIVFLGIYIGKKDREKREYLRLQKEKEAIVAEEKKIRDEEKARSEAADKTLKEETTKMITELSAQLKDRAAKIKEIVFLSRARLKFDDSYLDNFSVDALTDIELERFFTISGIKKQIVWDPDFELVMKMYAALYGRYYEDSNLVKIIVRFEKLVSYLNKYKEFIGYPVIKGKISETKIPVTWEK